MHKLEHNLEILKLTLCKPNNSVILWLMLVLWISRLWQERKSLASEYIVNIAVDMLAPEYQCICFLKDKTPQTGYLSIGFIVQIVP